MVDLTLTTFVLAGVYSYVRRRVSDNKSCIEGLGLILLPLPTPVS